MITSGQPKRTEMEIIKLIIYISIYIGLVATTFYVLSYRSAKKRGELKYSDSELPSVSILIPAYNEEKSIVETIKSALGSDYPKEKLEIIVIDDGSKDRTYELAKKMASSRVKVFTKKNGGKGSALNYGLKHAKGYIVVTMDADTFIESWTLKNMVRYFKDEEVMSVSPAISIHEPRSLLQRVQHIEYLMGLFLRKAFASLDAVFVTPGAFSAYRHDFFRKHGGFDEGNITEDLEMALRVQYNNYKIQNSPDSPVYTIAPNKFLTLLKQRRRWYYGLIKNTVHYRKMFGRQYGDLGLFVMPVAWISVAFSVFLTTYLFFKTLFKVGDEFAFLHSVNFDPGNLIKLNHLFFERLFYLFFTNTVVVFILFFMVILGFYLYYAKKKIRKTRGLMLNLPLFFIFFAIFFGFWWIVSIFYFLFTKGVSWR